MRRGEGQVADSLGRGTEISPDGPASGVRKKFEILRI